MRCNVCGRYTNNEEANFCEYCGSPYREHFQAYHDLQQNNGQNRYNYGENRGYQQENKPVSFLDFLASYGLFFIPFAGWLIFLVMLFIWSFSNNTPVSKKNWARATLIFVGIMMLFMVFYMMYVISSPIFQNMINGSFDYNKYIQSIR